MDRKEIKTKIIKLLESTNRPGMLSLLVYLEENGFYEELASARGHNNYIGGLAEHSLRVYNLLLKLCPTNIGDVTRDGQRPLPVNADAFKIAALLHDICKIGAYVPTKAGDGWTSNRNKEKGHAILSIARIKKYIELTELEEMMIKYHMGVYGLVEFDQKSGEYGLRGGQMANAWHHNSIVKMMYFCDELATLEETLNEQ